MNVFFSFEALPLKFSGFQILFLEKSILMIESKAFNLAFWLYNSKRCMELSANYRQKEKQGDYHDDFSRSDT